MMAEPTNNPAADKAPEKASDKAGAKAPAVSAALSAREIKMKKELNKSEQEKADLLKRLEKLETESKEESKVAVKEDDVTIDPRIDAMAAQIKLLSDQLMITQSAQLAGGKPRYKPVPADDFQEEGVTFSSRRVFYVIGSYLNPKGVEVMPPYKLIKLQYAASDRRKDGREETIVNSCTFTTHLNAEIKFLREHPLYNIEFFENLNKTMTSDGLHREFRVRAASQVTAMSDEAILRNAHEMSIKNAHSRPLKELRAEIAMILGNQYVKDAEVLEGDLQRRRVLGAAINE